mmetsp:Transcript_19070/g.28987  ORF Transcript_19070/g.28987 Transcript_19070/m.28987 type:complete len:306 (-) Transcript_19070:179-1096(-)|eukprot:CAMPEP_0118710588 /NCGR_PEP_ID=MMETSP0800-20121206/23488_1 /TAXON_ID=210618 ORGANISM="Striatella unipunctata, Strain CCMP2910" /NCGR_SAMPLE_ID=MMETSP0800 /ASSEMBLY_ACC=CAM_ASM_000638 /LENGTH=305 /DNA_ID=CAMNT_0006614833 /DNA_START=57 /DNA_END=974 /DNA_ORIENTATION=+
MRDNRQKKSFRVIQRSFEEGWDELPEDYYRRQQRLEELANDAGDAESSDDGSESGVETMFRSVFGSCAGVLNAASYFNPRDQCMSANNISCNVPRRMDMKKPRRRPGALSSVDGSETFVDDNVSAISSSTLNEMAWREHLRGVTPHLHDGIVTFKKPDSRPNVIKIEGSFRRREGAPKKSRDSVDSASRETDDDGSALSPVFLGKERSNTSYYSRSANTTASSTTTEFTSVWKSPGKKSRESVSEWSSTSPQSVMDSHHAEMETPFEPHSRPAPKQFSEVDVGSKPRVRSWGSNSAWGSISQAEF